MIKPSDFLSILGDLAENDDKDLEMLLDTLARRELNREEIRQLENSLMRCEHGSQMFQALFSTRESERSKLVAMVSGVEAPPDPNIDKEAEKPEKNQRASTGRYRKVFFIGAPLAAAAAIAVFVIVSVTSSTKAPFPIYTMEVSGGDRDVRGEKPRIQPDRVVLTGDSGISIVLRPETSFQGNLVFEAYIGRRTDESLERLSLKHEISDNGTIVIEGSASSVLGNRTGELVLFLVLSRKGVSLEDKAASDTLKTRCTENLCELFEKEIELVEP